MALSFLERESNREREVCGRHSELLFVFGFLLFEADDRDFLANPVFRYENVCAAPYGFRFFLKGFSSLECELSYYTLFILNIK